MSNLLDGGALGRVWLAPMTGISDLPFRRTAARLGARYVATEMVACEQLVAQRPDVIRRAAVGEGLPVMVVQLVGADERMVARGAQLAEAAGAEIIDLNFGCPAKSVTGIACGSALMRDPAAAQRLVAAAVDATSRPVTVKMRLGWDAGPGPAVELAQRAQEAGAQALTVHGRTRMQFYGGAADWRAVGAVQGCVDIPVAANGDVTDPASAALALEQSNACAVMIGRAAIGRPWLAASVESGLDGRAFDEPGPQSRLDIVRRHLEESLAFYGPRLGLLMFRKHLAAYIDAAPWPQEPAERRAARARLCRLDCAAEIAVQLRLLWTTIPSRLAA
jgi:nifR3 family TIM-barrel protein